MVSSGRCVQWAWACEMGCLFFGEERCAGVHRVGSRSLRHDAPHETLPAALLQHIDRMLLQIVWACAGWSVRRLWQRALLRKAHG